jgi:hypothetical protein
MPDTTHQYRVTDFDTIPAFFDEIERRPHIRLIKVDDQGLFGSVRRGSASYMQPMVRLVATAFDHHNNEILRWEKTHDVGDGAVIPGIVGNGSRKGDLTGARTRDEIIRLAELRSLTASRGEWTAKSIGRTLAGV